MKKPKLKTTVTLREIEKAGPCSGEYMYFLRDIKSSAVPTGVYAGYAAKRSKTPEFGPDDPISLAMLLAKKTKPTGAMTWPRRVAWLLNRVDSLEAASRVVEARVDDIRNGASEVAMREVIGG